MTYYSGPKHWGCFPWETPVEGKQYSQYDSNSAELSCFVQYALMKTVTLGMLCNVFGYITLHHRLKRKTDKGPHQRCLSPNLKSAKLAKSHHSFPPLLF